VTLRQTVFAIFFSSRTWVIVRSFVLGLTVYHSPQLQARFTSGMLRLLDEHLDGINGRFLSQCE
jgi:hypothetical protein